jgi:hypothetical protein
MEITPNLRAVRFDQVGPGDLFLVQDGTGSYVAIAVKDPRAGDMMMLLLGPASADALYVPVLTNLPSHTPVVSFSKNYQIRLPCETKAWFITEPQPQNCVVLSEDRLYIRPLYGWAGQSTRCYIDANDGSLLMDGSGQFARPRGECAYALEWSFWTTETEPREIFRTPTGS